MNEVAVYLVLTFALSLACAAGTWFSYKAFVLYVNRYDRRYWKKVRAYEQRAAESFAPSRRPAETPAEDYWPEIIDG